MGVVVTIDRHRDVPEQYPRSVRRAYPAPLDNERRACRHNREESVVSIDGSWEITVQTPMGPQASKLEVRTDGTTLTGTQSGAGDQTDIYEGSVDGDNATWKIDVKQPFPMTVTFNATVAGQSISGTAQAGAFPPAPFTGNAA
jgi:hypothetical protein